MSSQSNVTRSMFAIVAALLMSSVTVGAAVGPAQTANPVSASVNA